MPNKSQFKHTKNILEYYRKYRDKNQIKLRRYKRTYNKKWRKENGYASEMKWIKNNPEAVRAQRLLRIRQLD